jgi:hypothetical protein
LVIVQVACSLVEGFGFLTGLRDYGVALALLDVVSSSCLRAICSSLPVIRFASASCAVED